MISKKLLGEIVKFAIIGGISTVVNYGIFFLLFRHFGLHYLWASACGFLSGVVISYTGNRLWTFDSKEEKKLKEFGGYLAVCLVTISISLGFLNLQVQTLHVTPLLANFFAICLSAGLNFIFVKLFIFKKN